jgi:hypothetical protein
MEFGEVPMLVIIAVVSKLLDDKGSDGSRSRAKGYRSCLQGRYTTTLIPVINDRLSSTPHNVLGNCSQSWPTSSQVGATKLASPSRPTLAGDLGVNAARPTNP